MKMSRVQVLYFWDFDLIIKVSSMKVSFIAQSTVIEVDCPKYWKKIEKLSLESRFTEEAISDLFWDVERNF